jgi:hypothetical protein
LLSADFIGGRGGGVKEELKIGRNSKSKRNKRKNKGKMVAKEVKSVFWIRIRFMRMRIQLKN